MNLNLMNSAQSAVFAPAQVLIAGVWQGLLLAAIAGIGLKAFPRISPRSRFLLWLNVLVLAALLPFFAGFRLSAPVSLTPQSGAAASVLSIPVPHLPGSWAEALVAFWAFASLLSLGRLLSSGYGLWLLSRTAVPLSPGAMSPEVRSVLAKSGSRPVELCLSPRVDSPAVIGFFRRVIVIPEWLLDRLTQPELKQVLIHELAHLDRRDDWTNLLQKVLRAIFPLNPALILADRQLCREREMACDDAVLDAAVTPRAYATCLAALAEKRMLRRAGSLAPGAWRGRSELAQRVHRILANHRRHGATPAFAVLLSASLFAGVGLARSPQVVAFSTAASVPLPDSPRLAAAARVPRPAEYEPATFHAVSSSSVHAAGQSGPRPGLNSHVLPGRVKETEAADFSPSRLSRAGCSHPPLSPSRHSRLSRSRSGLAQPTPGALVSPVVLEFWEPSPAMLSGGDLPFPEIAIFQSRTSWIVIQL